MEILAQVQSLWKKVNHSQARHICKWRYSRPDMNTFCPAPRQLIKTH